MKWMLVLFPVVTLLVIGCTGEQASSGDAVAEKQPPIPRSFFDRTITYMVEPEAMPYMSKVQSLVARAEGLEQPLPDDILLPIYRNADLNRDHRITAVEAKTFYQSYVLRFEDALGGIR